MFPYDILQTHWMKAARPRGTVSSSVVRFNLLNNKGETLESIRTKLEKNDDYKLMLTVAELHKSYETFKNENFWKEFCNQIQHTW